MADVNAFGSPTMTPITPGGTTPIGPQGPQFSDIQKLLTPQTNAQGISPEASNVMNLINQQRDYYAHLGESQAKARATQFGNAGSSIEQFGIASADQTTNQAALGAQSNVLTSDMANQLAMRQQLAGLTSDEIASLRNMGLSQQGLNLQQSLGQQGINLGYQNLNQAAKLGQQQGTNQLIGSLAPLLFGGGGFGGFGGGGTNWLSGLGASGASPSLTAGGAGGGFGALGANPLSAYGTGAGGAGATPGMFSGFGGGASLGATLGAGAGGMLLGQQTFGNNRYSNFGGVAGGFGGSAFGPLGAAAGSFAGEGIGNAVGNLTPQQRWAIATGGLSLGVPAVGKALGLSGGSGQSSYQSGQIGGKQAGDVDTATLATTLGKNPGQIAYDSNKKGSFEAAYNAQLARLSPDDLVTRYSTLTNKDYFNTAQDQNQKKAYDAAIQLNGGQPISGSQYSWYLANFGSRYGLS